MSANKVDLEALARDLQGINKPPRSRWLRILKWFLAIVLLLVIAGGGYAYWYFQQVFGNEAYKQAMVKIRENPDIKAALGEPIESLYANPLPSFLNDGNNFDMRWSISGSEKKTASVCVKTRLMNKNYETVSVGVVLPGGKSILLNDEEGGNVAPPFTPPAAPNAKPISATDSPEKPAAEDMPEDLMPKIPKAEESK